MRQVGILAAAGIYAIDNHIPELKIDHTRAKKLALTLNSINQEFIKPELVETNIVAVNLSVTGRTAGEIAGELKSNGVLAGALGKHFLRLVTHRDLTDAQIDETCQILEKILK